MKIDELIQELEKLEGNGLVLLIGLISLAYDFYSQIMILTSLTLYYGWINNAYKRIN